MDVEVQLTNTQSHIAVTIILMNLVYHFSITLLDRKVGKDHRSHDQVLDPSNDQ
jgi:hypothetical protein